MTDGRTSRLALFAERYILLLFLFIAGIAGVFLYVLTGKTVGFIFYLLPLFVFFAILCISSPLRCFLMVYIASFVLMGIGRYFTLVLPAGAILDILIFINFLSLTLHYIRGNTLGKVYFNPFLLVTVLWMLFCILEVINPNSTFDNWITTVRNIGMHIVLFQVLIFTNLDRLDKIKLFFGVWGVLIVLGALKAIGQKHIGLDAFESEWLYHYGAHTHLIYSGVRYFSFFTDAANFGCHMGLGIVVFAILALYEKRTYRRIFYTIVVSLAAYGLMISGTRAAMAVPFVGFAVFIVLVKEWKWVIVGLTLLLLAFSFFNLTQIGNGNADVRRMRTAFSFSKDASFNVRLENQKKMRTFMSGHPLGMGLGSSKHTNAGDQMHGIATDSSFVFIWIETGIVGLIFYIVICVMIIGFGIYFVFHRLKERAVRSIVAASTSGLAGIMIAGYANEVLHQMPTGQTVYILMGIIMISPLIDKQLSNGGSTD